MLLSRAAYFADFLLAPLLIGYLALSASVPHTIAGIGAWFGWVAGGFAVWTLVEYGVHRFVYHRVPYFREIHDAHHAMPNALIGAPPVVGLALILLVFYLPATGFGPVAAGAFTIGALVGYLAYMVLHHAAHHGHVRPGSWLYHARRHHGQHHHASDEGNFGITTSVWDHVFGTALTPRRDTRRRVHP